MSPNPSVIDEFDKNNRYPFGKSLSEFSYDMGGHGTLPKRISRTNSIAGSIDHEDASMFLGNGQPLPSEVDSEDLRKKMLTNLKKDFENHELPEIDS